MSVLDEVHSVNFKSACVDLKKKRCTQITLIFSGVSHLSPFIKNHDVHMSRELKLLFRIPGKQSLFWVRQDPEGTSCISASSLFIFIIQQNHLKSLLLSNLLLSISGFFVCLVWFFFLLVFIDMKYLPDKKKEIWIFFSGLFYEYLNARSFLWFQSCSHLLLLSLSASSFSIPCLVSHKDT